eukprot:8161355-Pyramimonas_sp.AAC.1
MADPDTFDERAIVRAMVSRSVRNTQDRNWLVAMSCCRAALRPITANTTQQYWDRRPIFTGVRTGGFILVKNWGQINCYHYDNHYPKGGYNTR